MASGDIDEPAGAQAGLKESPAKRMGWDGMGWYIKWLSNIHCMLHSARSIEDLCSAHMHITNSILHHKYHVYDPTCPQYHVYDPTCPQYHVYDPTCPQYHVYDPTCPQYHVYDPTCPQYHVYDPTCPQYHVYDPTCPQ